MSFHNARILPSTTGHDTTIVTFVLRIVASELHSVGIARRLVAASPPPLPPHILGATCLVSALAWVKRTTGGPEAYSLLEASEGRVPVTRHWQQGATVAVTPGKRVASQESGREKLVAPSHLCGQKTPYIFTRTIPADYFNEMPPRTSK
ncbi:hypothetical protein BJV78DRAFT_1152358 [Lactifluus subvellereus]|nr:hypothetical protein BJV78DRAFT_1152358 [Lactifluus subvellereus]